MPDRGSYDPLDDLVDRNAATEAPRRGPVAWWRQRPRWSRITLAVLGVLVAYYAVSLAQVVHTGRQHSSEPVDAIVVLGAAQYDGRPSPQLKARLDHAVTLWADGVAPTVMVTGGKRPGDRFTEAEASRMYLIDSGVPDSAIMLENAGQTTYDSLEVASALLLDAGLGDVVLVSDAFHLKRSALIADSFGLDARVSATPTSVVTGWSSLSKHLQEAGGVALGRIVGFDRLDDLTN
jgi:vancomycin permeability regulator SanA